MTFPSSYGPAAGSGTTLSGFLNNQQGPNTYGASGPNQPPVAANGPMSTYVSPSGYNPLTGQGSGFPTTAGTSITPQAGPTTANAPGAAALGGPNSAGWNTMTRDQQNQWLSGQAQQSAGTGTQDPLLSMTFPGTSAPSTSNFMGTNIPVPSLNSLQAQQASYANNPYLLTPAYQQQQNAMMAQSQAATPSIYPSGWNDLTNSQQLALQYSGQYPDALAAQFPGQSISQILGAFRGPTTGLNAPMGSANYAALSGSGGPLGQQSQPASQQPTQGSMSAVSQQNGGMPQSGSGNSQYGWALAAALQQLLGGGGNSQSQYSTTTTPLGYTQYQGQPQQQSQIDPQTLMALFSLFAGRSNTPSYGGFGSNLGGL